MINIKSILVTNITVIAIIVISSAVALAQGPPSLQDDGKIERYDKMKALKVAYITTKLDLTTAEAQVFWPLYNEYQEKRVDLKKQEGRSCRIEVDVIDGMTEEQLQGVINTYLDLEEQEVALETKYIKQFTDVLSARKVVLLLRAEHDFRKEVMKELQKREHQERD